MGAGVERPGWVRWLERYGWVVVVAGGLLAYHNCFEGQLYIDDFGVIPGAEDFKQQKDSAAVPHPLSNRWPGRLVVRRRPHRLRTRPGQCSRGQFGAPPPRRDRPLGGHRPDVRSFTGSRTGSNTGPGCSQPPSPGFGWFTRLPRQRSATCPSATSPRWGCSYSSRCGPSPVRGPLRAGRIWWWPLVVRAREARGHIRPRNRRSFSRWYCWIYDRLFLAGSWRGSLGGGRCLASSRCRRLPSRARWWRWLRTPSRGWKMSEKRTGENHFKPVTRRAPARVGPGSSALRSPCRVGPRGQS